MSSTPKLGACALCRKPKELRVSHIASRFLWRNSGITGHKKSFSVLSATHPELNRSNLQDGFKERLLCQDCESQFATYEDYAARSLFHRQGPVHNRSDSHYIFSGLSYAKIKLFQMSILWRMCVSKDPFYCMVELGRHEEDLRRMLCLEDPGEPWRYGCIAAVLEHEEQPLIGIFSQPVRHKMFGRQCFSYTIAGLHLTQFVTSHPFEKTIVDRMLLREDGSWVLFRGKTADIPTLMKQIELYRQIDSKP